MLKNKQIKQLLAAKSLAEYKRVEKSVQSDFYGLIPREVTAHHRKLILQAKGGKNIRVGTVVQYITESLVFEGAQYVMSISNDIATLKCPETGKTTKAKISQLIN